MSNFGALTDHFSLASSDLVLVDSTETKIELSRADAQDENGDIAASAFYGNTTQDMREVSCTYALKSGTLNINTIKLGALAATPTLIRESVEVSTSNSEFPQITVSGRKNAVAPTAPTGKANTFTLPSLSIVGRKVAQPVFFTTGANCRLTASSVESSIEIAQQDNGLGEPIAHGLSGGTGTFTGEFVRISAAPSWSVTIPSPNTNMFAETQAPGQEQGQAAFHTGTGTGAFTIIRDNATP